MKLVTPYLPYSGSVTGICQQRLCLRGRPPGQSNALELYLVLVNQVDGCRQSG